MSPRPKALIITLILMLLLGFVSACGYKDDLYLPDKEEAQDDERKKKTGPPEVAGEPSQE